MTVLLWIIIGAMILGVVYIARKKGGKKFSSGKPFRIDHLHYMEDDDYECSKCGARFGQRVMECPRCGAKFRTAREDDLEFIEEMEIFDGDED